MIEKQKVKNSNNENFNYLGKNYDIVYSEYYDISFGNDKVFLNKNIDIDKWYKKQAKIIFKEHLDEIYSRFSKRVPYPNLVIRKMSTRWGVCNRKNTTVTLNSELLKYDITKLDYVIVHELSHFIHPNHSKEFWKIVEKYCPNYKEIRRKLRS